MKTHSVLCLSATLTVLLMMETSWAANQKYISDQCLAPMRRGESVSYKIITALKSGTQVTLVSEGSKGMDLIRTSDGKEGWVEHNQLTDEPTARTRLDAAEKISSTATEKITALTTENTELKAKLATAEAARTELEALKKISGDAVNMAAENKQLNATVEKLHAEVATLTDDKKYLERQSDNVFFMAGAGVLALGLAGGSVMSRRRRSYGGLE